MKKNLTEIVYILDRSGSMSGLENDTVGGYNSFIEKQKREEGEAVITTVLFDDKYEILHDKVDVKKLGPITNKQYFARGMTALIDAIGKTVERIAHRHKTCLDSELPEKTVFVITTDGLENASHEFDAEKIKKMIELQKKEYGWEFLFLGANIDAVETAKNFGINEDRAVTYRADSKGTKINFNAVGNAVSRMRACHPIEKNWKSAVEMHERNGK